MASIYFTKTSLVIGFQGDVVHEGCGRKDDIRTAVELLLRHPGVPVGANNRRRVPTKTPAGPTPRGGLPGHRDPHRQQPGRG